ncbi:MAG: cytochrome C [Candidatus Eremiobacterota bacterium]
MSRWLSIDPDLKVLLPDGTTRPMSDYVWPTAILMLASLLLTLSLFTPFWSLTMKAPQYPQGLKVTVFIDRVQGDVDEIDGLNHYLGMPSLNEGGKIERQISVLAVGAMALLVLAGVFIHNRWAGILALPAVIFPGVFLADLQYILYHYGHSIDPESALGQAIQPFTPPLLGVGHIGQFSTVAEFGPGLYLTMAASLLVLVGLYFHRRAYKAVRDARKRMSRR